MAIASSCTYLNGPTRLLNPPKAKSRSSPLPMRSNHVHTFWPNAIKDASRKLGLRMHSNSPNDIAESNELSIAKRPLAAVMPARRTPA